MRNRFVTAGAVALAAAATFITPGAAAAPHVINPGTTAWVSAARIGRADMLVIGDSVTLVQGEGWDAGLNRSAHHRLGLAGTGLAADGYFTGEGEGWANFGGQNFVQGTAAVPASRNGYVWNQLSVTADATPRGGFGFGVDGLTLPTDAAYDWHLYTASPAGGGSMQAFRRLGVPPYTAQAPLAAIPTATPADGLQHSVFSFAPMPGGGAKEFYLANTTDTSVLYSRLLRPGATGATVTSWGYGGQSTLDFYNDRYKAMSDAGRRAFLAAVVDGGSGKLNVVIAEGFNDRNETEPSVTGNPAGNSPAAFADNVAALIAHLRQDWAAAGKSAGDLSFTLLGMYEVGDGNTLLRAYAAELGRIATADPGISFVDVYELAPSYAAGNAAGYFLPNDPIHLSRQGSLVYGDLVLGALVPEPGSAALLAGGVLLHGLRRRRPA